MRYVAAIAHHSAIIILKKAIMSKKTRNRLPERLYFRAIFNQETPSNLFCSQKLVISQEDIKRSKKYTGLINAIERNKMFVCVRGFLSLT